MTYLQLVNAVLTRMREDEVSTLAGSSDPVVNIVKDYVNDAKQLVEDAHTWNALRDEWSIATVDGTENYALTGAGDRATIEYIWSSDSVHPRQRQLSELRRRKVGDDGSKNQPSYWAPNGVDGSGDLQLYLYPTPDGVYNYTVGGFARTADLSADNDSPIIPTKPILYFALAYSLRERGEVGGQTAAEVFGMANAYLSDAIAYDAINSDLDNIWTTV